MAQKTIATNYLVGQAAALVLNPAEAAEKTVRGLVGLTLPLGFEMSNIVVQEMGRRIDIVVPSGGAYTPIDIQANFVPGDPTQQFFQDAALNSTKITKMRFYLKQGCDFAALDLINDSGGAYLIGTFSPPSVASKNELFQNQITILPAGSSLLFVAHTPPGQGTTLSYVASTRTISVSGGDAFDTDYGFEVGDVCLFDWFDSMAPQYVEVESISGADMVFTAGVGDVGNLGDASGIATTQLHGATPIEVTGLDLTCD